MVPACRDRDRVGEAAHHDRRRRVDLGAIPQLTVAVLAQQLAFPFASTAHEWTKPAEIATALMRPRTTTGVDERIRVRSPTGPLGCGPAFGGPFANTTHEW